jgi:phosphatidate cytidylyltransferase
MVKRLLISALVIPPFLWVMLFGPPVYFEIFAAICIFVGFAEYRQMMQNQGLGFSLWPGLVALFVLVIPAIISNLPGQAKAAGAVNIPLVQGLSGFFIVLGCLYVAHPDIEKGMLRFMSELCGPLYLGVLGMHLILMHQLHNGGWWVFVCFWYAWFYDAFGLFIGKPFGRRKLSPLSPSKTWEGFLGGAACTALISWLVLPLVLAKWGPSDFPLSGPMLGLLAIPASVLAQAGDLFESMLKRFAGVKDSSQLISAMGGFLDKMDSTLFVGPALYMLALLLGVGPR